MTCSLIDSRLVCARPVENFHQTRKDSEYKGKLQGQEAGHKSYLIFFSQRSNHDPFLSPITCSLRIIVLHGLRGQ